MPPTAEPKLWRADRPGRCIALVSLVLAVGCGRAAAPEAQPTNQPGAAASPEPTTLDQAEAELEQARAELEQASLAMQGAPVALSEATVPATAPPAAAPPPTTPAPAPAAAEKEARPEARSAPKKAVAADLDEGRDDTAASSPASGAAASAPLSSCERSCKAYGSLKRARDAICRLDEQGGARCSRADGVVRDAEGKVQSCGCPR